MYFTRFFFFFPLLFLVGGYLVSAFVVRVCVCAYVQSRDSLSYLLSKDTGGGPFFFSLAVVCF